MKHIPIVRVLRFKPSLTINPVRTWNIFLKLTAIKDIEEILPVKSVNIVWKLRIETQFYLEIYYIKCNILYKLIDDNYRQKRYTVF